MSAPEETRAVSCFSCGYSPVGRVIPDPIVWDNPESQNPFVNTSQFRCPRCLRITVAPGQRVD